MLPPHVASYLPHLHTLITSSFDMMVNIPACAVEISTSDSVHVMCCCVAGLLEETLGSFYAPSRPLSDVTVLQFRDMISKLSRRFFHHLLRYWSQNKFPLFVFKCPGWNSFRRIWICYNVTVNLKSSEMSWCTCTTKIVCLYVPLIKPSPHHWCKHKHQHKHKKLMR